LKSSPYILSFLFVFFLCCISFKIQAQIITDSDAKLRTIKVKKKGHGLFNGNKNRGKRREGDGAYVLGKRLKYAEFANHEFEKNKIRSVVGQKNHFNTSELSWFTLDLFINRKSWASFTGPALTDLSVKKSDQGGYLNSKNRDWNLLWVKLGPSTHTPQGIKERVSPAKFDKKERKIWNN